MQNSFDHTLPDAQGYFGEYGGSFIPPELESIMVEIAAAYEECRKDPAFRAELARLYKHFVGRPSPIFHAENLSKKYGADIYLKREDLNHTGAHKINHCLGEALLAKKMGKKKLIAETGAGQHGVALATAAALVGLECDIYMGEVDIRKEHPNVVRMRILGANVIPATHGRKTLKEAVDSAFEAYMKDPVNQLYAIGSVVGPHPFPMMVRDFQSIIGNEAKVQFQEMTGGLPRNLVACVGGGSNAMGLFTAFLDDEGVAIHGCEPAGRSLNVEGEHAATLTLGEPGIMHGFKSYMLKDKDGEPQEVYSVASGLDYPSVGPQHSYLKDSGRVSYGTVSDDEAIDAFFELSRLEGIIPAIESSHAVAYAFKLAKQGEKGSILINLSGRGDKDIDFVVENYGKEYGIGSLT
ncbi:tryptophan synthase subunit beta [Grimontia hollisae]|uniref:Tryptophan synthase beta chain n=1 Tax=Grimontia hollisae CIP 101886 TaxID=675812 RepID=D0I6I4_GRIHO|nr:tryptophan synthase subunit beta [Grimontia hollisae]AMG31557.1 tryptophan synthase subunit beta [Grimontia hollisae]EEY72253.1 tryptophan synthase beta chain [Grimontia hollisae CIP 101886]MDF2185927.1 tryptophan synthase subunit beta [Grimontia hollisae]STO45356.1 Tryptophan synthase beta chain [Grimontia hollisae]STQ76366.1 Tryptophan synthase beta chain [Grimontia hollisae]